MSAPMFTLEKASFFTLEPRDVLLVRDGRAMNATVGRSLSFPYPSTLAGVVRTRLGSDGSGCFDRARIGALLRDVTVAGPLLTQLSADGDRVLDVLVPAPSDCVWYRDSGGAEIGRRLLPRSTHVLAAGGLTDLGPEAELLAHDDPQPEGKWARGPAFWSWATLLAWLEHPSDPLPISSVAGLGAFARELRMHVTIDTSTGTAEDGALFGTESIRLELATEVDDPETKVGAEGSPRRKIRSFQRYALLGGWAGPGTLARGLIPVGGKRHATFLENIPRPALSPPLACPASIAAVGPGDRARVVLLTPAVFSAGSFPETICGAKVVAAKVDAPEVASGWDFANNRPKPTRRLAPAGSVYWVDIPEGSSEAWAKRVWLTHISDDEQSCRDGFGLAVVGVA